MSVSNSEILHKSAYLAVFQNWFLDSLFYQETQDITPAFRFLATSRCISDLLSSGGTDFNLHDGRFWLTLDPGFFAHQVGVPTPESWTPGYASHAREEDLYVDKEDEFAEAHDRVRDQIWKIRTKRDLETQGYAVSELFRKYSPTRKTLKSAYVAYLGPVRLMRNALPSLQRSRTFPALASLINQDHWFSSFVFGLSPTTDQSLSHIPLSVGNGRAVHCQETSFDEMDRIHLPDSVVTTSGKLRVHLYPYGLCTSYLTLTLSAPTGFTTTDLIVFLRRLLHSKPNDPRRITCIIGKHYSGSATDLHSWVGNHIGKAILQPGSRHRIAASQVKTAVCLNTKRVVSPSAGRVPRELIGILMRDASWKYLDESYTNSYRSFFGRYVGQFAVSSADNLLLSFGSTWAKHAKRKARVRFYWSLLGVYQFVTARSFLSQLLGDEIAKAGTDESSNERGYSRVRRIWSWLDSVMVQHRRLFPSRRKFFYTLGRSLHLETKERKVLRSIDRHEEMEAIRSSCGRLWEGLYRGFADVKWGQSAIYTKLVEVDSHSLWAIGDAVLQGRIEQGEIARTLDAVRRALRFIQTAGIELNNEVRELTAIAENAIESRLGLREKLFLTLPIVPLFMNYSVELEAESKLDLHALRSEIEARWKELATKARK